MLLTCRESRDVPALFFRLYPLAPLCLLLTYRHFQARKKPPECPATKDAFHLIPSRERTAGRPLVIALPQLPSRPGPVGPKLKMAIPWESVEAGEESCGCREEQGVEGPSVNAPGERLRVTLLSSPF